MSNFNGSNLREKSPNLASLEHSTPNAKYPVAFDAKVQDQNKTIASFSNKRPTDYKPVLEARNKNNEGDPGLFNSIRTESRNNTEQQLSRLRKSRSIESQRSVSVSSIREIIENRTIEGPGSNILKVDKENAFSKGRSLSSMGVTGQNTNNQQFNNQKYVSTGHQTFQADSQSQRPVSTLVYGKALNINTYATQQPDHETNPNSARGLSSVVSHNGRSNAKTPPPARYPRAGSSQHTPHTMHRGYGLPPSSANELAHATALQELADLKKEMQRKEAICMKEEALLKQRIELLQMQVKEGEEREASQKNMYDKMFTALNPMSMSPNTSPVNSRRKDESNSSREAIDDMQKQFTQQMQSRISELEEQLTDYKDRAKLQIEDKQAELEKERNIQIQETKRRTEAEIRAANLERNLRQTEYDVKQLKQQLTDNESEIKSLNSKWNQELESMRQQSDQSITELTQDFEEQLERAKKQFSKYTGKSLSVTEENFPVFELKKPAFIAEREQKAKNTKSTTIDESAQSVSNTVINSSKEISNSRNEVNEVVYAGKATVEDLQAMVNKIQHEQQEKEVQFEKEICLKEYQYQIDLQTKDILIEKLREESLSAAKEVEQITQTILTEKDEQLSQQNTKLSLFDSMEKQIDENKTEIIELNIKLDQKRTKMKEYLDNTHEQQQKFLNRETQMTDELQMLKNQLEVLMKNQESGTTSNNTQPQNFIYQERQFTSQKKTPKKSTAQQNNGKSPAYSQGSGVSSNCYDLSQTKVLQHQQQQLMSFDCDQPVPMLNQMSGNNVNSGQFGAANSSVQNLGFQNQCLPDSIIGDQLQEEQIDLAYGQINAQHKRSNEFKPIQGNHFEQELVQLSPNQQAFSDELDLQSNLTKEVNLIQQNQNLIQDSTSRNSVIKNFPQHVRHGQFFTEKGTPLSSQQSQPMTAMKNLTEEDFMLFHNNLQHCDDLGYLREKVSQLIDHMNRLRLENDRLNLQVEQKKTQLALVEEKRAGNELKMKLEIKYLLEQWINAKQQTQEEEFCNVNQFSTEDQQDKNALISVINSNSCSPQIPQHNQNFYDQEEDQVHFSGEEFEGDDGNFEMSTARNNNPLISSRPPYQNPQQHQQLSSGGSQAQMVQQHQLNEFLQEAKLANYQQQQAQTQQQYGHLYNQANQNSRQMYQQPPYVQALAQSVYMQNSSRDSRTEDQYATADHAQLQRRHLY